MGIIKYLSHGLVHNEVGQFHFSAQNRIYFLKKNITRNSNVPPHVCFHWGICVMGIDVEVTVRLNSEITKRSAVNWLYNSWTPRLFETIKSKERSKGVTIYEGFSLETARAVVSLYDSFWDWRFRYMAYYPLTHCFFNFEVRMVFNRTALRPWCTLSGASEHYETRLDSCSIHSEGGDRDHLSAWVAEKGPSCWVRAAAEPLFVRAKDAAFSTDQMETTQ